MCLGGSKKTELAPAVDPAVERQQAADSAQVAANADIAATRKLRQQQSLLATGAGNAKPATSGNSILAQGKLKLGS